MAWIGLTGVFGAGKSSVARMMAEEGARVLDADRVVRRLTGPGGAALEAIAAAFGGEVFGEDCGLDRVAMADIVFADPDARKRLEGILHPVVFREAEAFRERVERETPGAIAVLEAPLLLEAGYEANMDGLVVVVCREDVILDRSAAAGVPEDDTRRRWAAQLSQEEKKPRGDWVIDNSGSQEETRKRVKEIVAEIRERFPD